MSRICKARRGAEDERAFTLTEMIVVLAILSIVLSALIAVFVSALRTEVDQNRRFEAQQNARLALGKLRREIHCAQLANVAGGGTAVTLTNGSSSTTGYCPGGQSTWCTVAAGAGFSLYRGVGTTCDATGALMAEHLVANQVFELIYPVDSRAKLGVNLRVDVDPNDTLGAYRLFDEIVLRGSERA
jgi:prepilin-type N-terminal cleavage/methylation domain-containing protein